MTHQPHIATEANVLHCSPTYGLEYEGNLIIQYIKANSAQLFIHQLHEIRDICMGLIREKRLICMEATKPKKFEEGG